MCRSWLARPRRFRRALPGCRRSCSTARAAIRRRFLVRRPPAPKDGRLFRLLNSAPLLLERLATLTENLNLLLGPENQEEITEILRNSNRLTRELAETAPQLEATFGELQTALKEAGEALDSFERAANTTNQLLAEEGPSLAEELRGTLASANKAADQLAATLEDTGPAARQLRESTLPAAEATLQDLRATSRSLRAVTEKLDSQGIGGLVQGQTLPDYEPD